MFAPYDVYKTSWSIHNYSSSDKTILLKFYAIIIFTTSRNNTKFEKSIYVLLRYLIKTHKKNIFNYFLNLIPYILNVIVSFKLLFMSTTEERILHT